MATKTKTRPLSSIATKRSPTSPNGKTDPNAPLTHKQQMFVREYLIDQNGTRSVLAAGYTTNENTAAHMAKRMIRYANIRKELNAVFGKIQKKSEFKAEQVLTELRHLSTADIAKCFDTRGCLLPIHKIPKYIRKSIAGVETREIRVNGVKIGETKKIKFWDKTKALELTGKHYKMFTDKIEATGADGKPLVPDTLRCVVVLPPKDEK